MTASVENGVDEITLLRAETATLRQLLSVLERTALEQTTKLQESIRQRTLIADELRRQLDFTRAVTESMGDGVIALDTDGRVSFVNGAAAGILGRRREDLNGASLPDARIGGSSARILEVLQKGGGVMQIDDDAFSRPDGTEVPVATSISPMTTSGELRGAIVVFRDISSRKELEIQRQRLFETERAARVEAERSREVARFIADAGSALVGSIDYQSTLQRVARLSIPAFADWTFVHILAEDGTLRRLALAHSDPAKEKQVAAIDDTYPPTADARFGPAAVARSGQPELIRELTDDVLAGATQGREHLQAIKAFGFTSYLSVPLVARDKALGALTFAFAESARHYTDDDVLTARQLADRAALAIENSMLFADVEEARQTLERRVEERTTQLQEANRELESFSYSVSHDLRAPIRHISGFVDMLSRRASGSLDATSLHYLHAITTSAKYAGHLVDDLLAFSRMGRADMVRAHINMTQLAEQARSDLTPDIGSRQIEWKIDDLGEATVDASMMRLVWRNLLGNAVKYTRPREVAVIAVGREVADNEIRYFVRDNGVGFNMQYAEKLFGVFQRLHTPEQFEGTGIGLANVKRIVARHGGRTWAEGETDAGATFWFALPKTTVGGRG